jgi:hypothetical protein
MNSSKALSIREQTLEDSLRIAARQTPAEKIRIASKLSILCDKLSKAMKKKKR